MSTSRTEWPPRRSPGADAIRPHPVCDVGGGKSVRHEKGVPWSIFRDRYGMTISGPWEYIGRFPSPCNLMLAGEQIKSSTFNMAELALDVAGGKVP